MDYSGRVHERILLRVLGWQPGQRLDMDIVHGLIVVAAALGRGPPPLAALTGAPHHLAVS